ncbi:Uncharacterised protein [Legionella cherrii]|uniref:Uncharacterized protein n=1 Tax=Legionella cherrii TaxID=28084 RepID=A0ABY6T500_9GAMM|nr:Uncharacterised protein [Legionella cherrii]
MIQDNPDKPVEGQQPPSIVPTKMSFWERNRISTTGLTATVVGVTSWFATKK